MPKKELTDEEIQKELGDWIEEGIRRIEDNSVLLLEAFEDYGPNKNA